MHLQAVRNSEEAFKLQEDAQYGSSPFFPKDKVPPIRTLVNLLIKTATDGHVSAIVPGCYTLLRPFLAWKLPGGKLDLLHLLGMLYLLVRG